jgi:hypothetical protein
MESGHHELRHLLTASKGFGYRQTEFYFPAFAKPNNVVCNATWHPTNIGRFSTTSTIFRKFAV